MNPISSAPHRPTTLIRRQPWLVLISLSLAFGLGLAAVKMPGALLLGPLLAAIILGVKGARVRESGHAFLLAQGVIGCMMTRNLPPSVLHEIATRWPLLGISVLAVIGACALLGWIMTRLKFLPGSTALWGLSPGAASAMIVLAEDYGADSRLVAIMQYLRVVLAISAASLVARAAGVHPHLQPQAAAGWFDAVPALPLIETLGLAAGGALLGHRLRIPGGPLLIPIIAGLPLVHYGVLDLELPRWLLALTYAIVGWRVGLRFTPALLAHAARMMPRLLTCTLGLILACGGIAGLLVLVAGIDPLTAYLATSPGAADAVAIVASGSHADVPFVVTLQVLRFLVTLLLGPLLARMLAPQTPATSCAPAMPPSPPERRADPPATSIWR